MIARLPINNTPTPTDILDQDRTASAPPAEQRHSLITDEDYQDEPWIALLLNNDNKNTRTRRIGGLRAVSISSASPASGLDPICFASSSSPQEPLPNTHNENIDEDPAIRLARQWLAEIESCKDERNNYYNHNTEQLPKFPTPNKTHFRAAARVRRNWHAHANNNKEDAPPNF